jgi:hypothetical protein
MDGIRIGFAVRPEHAEGGVGENTLFKNSAQISGIPKMLETGQRLRELSPESMA